MSHHVSPGANVAFQRRTEALLDAISAVLFNCMIAQSRRFVVYELTKQLAVGGFVRSILRLSIEILLVLIVDFILVSITTADAINIQDPFQLSMG